jgi:hypothetical protein
MFREFSSINRILHDMCVGAEVQNLVVPFIHLNGEISSKINFTIIHNENQFLNNYFKCGHNHFFNVNEITIVIKNLHI